MICYLGNCNVPKPSWYDFRAKSKWEAWNALQDMPQSVAKEKYIELVSKLDTSFAKDGVGQQSTTKESWVTVSTLQKPEESDEDQDADELIASVKAGDHVAVDHFLCDSKEKYSKDFDWNRLDKDGMALIHWATDRGCTKIIKSLVENGADIQAKDAEGQTAIHYASSCGHLECVELLLELGADASIKDNDGADAYDAAADDAVKEFLKKCSLNIG